MKTPVLPLAVALASLATAATTYAQNTSFERLPPETFDVVPPSERVTGAPGEMSVRQNSCRVLPTGETRRRIVDVAVQEWGFFGFPILDRTIPDNRPRRRGDEPAQSGTSSRRRRSRLSPEESARVADSIAGYWAVTPDGAWILDRQNREWNGPRGIGSRWIAPWSAAFVSWVMCESGLGTGSQFQRAVAHHVYIDQAIRARDHGQPEAAFTAYDVGEARIAPGDLLCSARRPGYRTIAERRTQIGEGARTHCDVVVKVDVASERILAIGGNVRSTVSLKLLPAIRDEKNGLRPTADLFVHLKLRADPIEADALAATPTIRAISCSVGLRAPSQLVTTRLVKSSVRTDSC